MIDATLMCLTQPGGASDDQSTGIARSMAVVPAATGSYRHSRKHIRVVLVPMILPASAAQGNPDRP